jgi:hypothetical protein
MKWATCRWPGSRQRTYFQKDQVILLLHYRNDPYRQVYDTIKIIDQNNAVGVMHIAAHAAIRIARSIPLN